ncbi:MAG: hypothetical protein ACYTEL_24295 [Planctomycetota bacterium]
MICGKEAPEQSGLTIIHVTEGLSFYPDRQTVKMHVVIISKHEGKKDARYRVIHRGKTTAQLKKFTLKDPENEWLRLLGTVFRDRVKEKPGDSDKVICHRRVNCFGIDARGIEVSVAGPGRCFDKPGDAIPLSPEIEDPRQHVPFTSYVIPPLDATAIQPGETAICTVDLEISGPTYTRLVGVGSDISVDGYARLMRDIETYDLPGEGNEKYEELYHNTVKAKNMIIEPREYDIVIFQSIGQAVELKSGSISTSPARLPDEALSGKVLSFYGEGSEFCLRFAYPPEIVAEQRKIQGVAAAAG